MWSARPWLQTSMDVQKNIFWILFATECIMVFSNSSKNYFEYSVQVRTWILIQTKINFFQVLLFYGMHQIQLLAGMETSRVWVYSILIMHLSLLIWVRIWNIYWFEVSPKLVHDFNWKFSNPHIGYPLILTPGLTPIISLVNEQRSLLGETGFTRCKKVEKKFQFEQTVTYHI